MDIYGGHGGSVQAKCVGVGYDLVMDVVARDLVLPKAPKMAENHARSVTSRWSQASDQRVLDRAQDQLVEDCFCRDLLVLAGAHGASRCSLIGFEWAAK